MAVFTVGGIEQADKTTFPTERVYGDSDMAELRLITCGGTYNRSTRHYVRQCHRLRDDDRDAPSLVLTST